MVHVACSLVWKWQVMFVTSDEAGKKQHARGKWEKSFSHRIYIFLWHKTEQQDKVLVTCWQLLVAEPLWVWPVSLSLSLLSRLTRQLSSVSLPFLSFVQWITPEKHSRGVDLMNEVTQAPQSLFVLSHHKALTFSLSLSHSRLSSSLRPPPPLRRTSPCSTPRWRQGTPQKRRGSGSLLIRLCRCHRWCTWFSCQAAGLLDLPNSPAKL